MGTRTRETELHTITRGFSIDNPINFRHRSGDIESAGENRLDFYASTESAEEIFFESEDEKARRVFLKLFKKFLKTTYTKAERRFLIMSASGAKPQELRQRLGITDILKYREAVQKKGFENAEALRAAIVYSGWSKAEEFSETLFKRVELFRRGENIIETLPEDPRVWYKIRYRITHREEIKEYRKRYYKEHGQERREYSKQYRKAHHEETLQAAREYKKQHREEIREQRKKHYKENRETLKEKARIYTATLSEERKAALREYAKAYAERNREKIKARRKARYQREKMERLAAKLRAKENLPAIRIEEAEEPQEIIIE